MLQFRILPWNHLANDLHRRIISIYSISNYQCHDSIDEQWHKMLNYQFGPACAVGVRNLPRAFVAPPESTWCSIVNSFPLMDFVSSSINMMYNMWLRFNKNHCETPWLSFSKMNFRHQFFLFQDAEKEVPETASSWSIRKANFSFPDIFKFNPLEVKHLQLVGLVLLNHQVLYICLVSKC